MGEMEGKEQQKERVEERGGRKGAARVEGKVARGAAGEGSRKRGSRAVRGGLDPAEPYFQDTPAEVRLDPSDALLVDAIHTDSTPTVAQLGSGGYGMSQTVGHLDFFPNGGRHMPGCRKDEVISHVNVDDISPSLNDFVACNHLRSYRYYIESVLSPDGFIGFPGSSYDDFLGGAGFPCPSGGCARMGHDADKYRGVTAETQTFYLNTGDREKYSRWRYKVSVRTAGSSVILGNVAVSVQGSNGKTPEYTIYRGLIRPDTTYVDFIDSEVDVGIMSMATFVWRSYLPLIFHHTLGASTVTVQFGADGTKRSFCDSGTVLDSTHQSLRPCAEPAPL